MKIKLTYSLLLLSGLSSVALAAEPATGDKLEDANLGKIVVEGKKERKLSADTPYTSPSTSIDSEKAEGINAATIDDFIKYEPSLVVRRRYIGDPNGTLGMRGSNMFQTSRSMVFADGLPLHYQLQSQYSGAPRWSLVSPDETQSVEVVYGPFSAEYSGNAMGGVVNINTKLPTKFVFNAEASVFQQDFQYLGNNDTYSGHREYASVGDRFNNLSIYLFHNHLKNDSQPMTFRGDNSIETPAGGETDVSGAQHSIDASGTPTIYYGDTGPETAITDLTKLKMGYEMGEWLARFTLAYEDRTRDTGAPTNYLRDSNSDPVWGGDVVSNGERFTVRRSHFAVSEQERQTLLLGVALEGPIGKGWTLDTNVSDFDIVKDQSRSSKVNPQDPTYDGSGTVKEFDDTGWKTLDVKARSDSFLSNKDMNLVTGYHYDEYRLMINSYSSDNYAAGEKTKLTGSTGGDTNMHAAFAQWGWQFTPAWDVALGARYERWTTKNGKNYNYAGKNLDIATRTETGLSPKFSLGYKADNNWQYRYSLAKAYRFPITEELYHNEVKTNGTIIADDKLKPEEGLHHNLMFEKLLADGVMRVNLFHEVVKNVIFSQTVVVEGNNVSTFLPIDKVTTSGVEFVTQLDRLLHGKLDTRFNVTWTDSEITAHSSNPDLVGKTMPRMPEWRANLYMTWHFNKDLDASGGVRYASDSYNTLDNSDTAKNVFGGMDGYTFVDVKAAYKLGENGKLAVGIDNVTNEKAFVYHPWPQRTYYLEGKLFF